MTGTGWSISAGLSAGVLSAHFLFASNWVLWPFAMLLVFLWVFRRNVLLAATLVGFCWNAYYLSINLQDRLDESLTGSTQFVSGHIVGLPNQNQDLSRFIFSPDSQESHPALPARILTYWYQDPPELEPGQRWKLELHLKPPWGRVNFQGPDRELWLFSQQIGALATVRSGALLNPEPGTGFSLSVVRLKVRNQLVKNIKDQTQLGLVASLAIADRSFLLPELKEVLQLTGTSHLLAISGLHIGLAAFCGFWLTRLLLLLLPTQSLGGVIYPATLMGGFVFAFSYAAMAGFGTSTQRALIMLSVGILALLIRRALHPMHAIMSALALILMLNPLSALGSGLWLSFSAVSVLLIIFSTSRTQERGKWSGLLIAQFAIMLFMLPLSAWWFGAASVTALPANLLAIPMVSFVVVPLILMGMLLLPVSEVLSSQLLVWAGECAAFLLSILRVLAENSLSPVLLGKPAFPILLLSTLGGLLVLFPRGLRVRALGIALLLPVFATAKTNGGKNLQLEFLDVGQGTAILISNRQHLMLYDSGPGDGEQFNLVNEVIHPAILAAGRRQPDLIVISHGDLDHAGGLAALQFRYAEVPVFASLPENEQGILRCNTSFELPWEDFRLSVLHPGPFLPYLGNDSSCVVSIQSGPHSVLLAGDISQATEQRLVQLGIGAHDLLLVPHHGSKSSSGAAFISVLTPGMAVATAGLGNRFGFPLDEVKQRYLSQGAGFLSTESCGAIRVKFSENGPMKVQTARHTRNKPWRWNAGSNCQPSAD